MRATKKYNKSQLSLAFAPAIPPPLITTWERLKYCYPERLVWLVQTGQYVTLYQDASAISRVTGIEIRAGPVPYCAVPVQDAWPFFQKLSDHGLDFVICDPPTDPDRFLYT